MTCVVENRAYRSRTRGSIRNTDDLNVVIRSLSPRIRSVAALRVLAGTAMRDITGNAR